MKYFSMHHTFEIGVRRTIALSLFSSLLIFLRIVHTGTLEYGFLLWNLFLAWIPLGIASIWKNHTNGGRTKHWLSVVLFSCWLLFFPNSPYIITDLIHLRGRYNSLGWYDIIMVFTTANAGLLAGLHSLKLAHQCLIKSFGLIWSYAVVGFSIILTGFGVYMGRMLRWNSWDLFTNPKLMFLDILHHLFYPAAITMTIGFSTLLIVTYLCYFNPLHHEEN